MPSATRLERGIALFLILFLLVFPKGGIKLGGIPVTWGYLGLALIGAGTLPFVVLSGKLARCPRGRLVAAAALLPFQILSLLAFAVNGIEGMGFAVSFLVTFLVVPWIFLLILGPYLDRIDLGMVLRWVRAGIFAVAVYGIFLFFVKLGTGRYIEIPMLTVNLGDVGEMEGKFNDRGGVFKLISTYNNGNIYGISLLLLLPLYGLLENRRWRVSVVKLSLLLTLSRTVWIGMILNELASKLFVRRLSMRSVFSLSLLVALLALGISYLLELLGLPIAFLFDARLGGRISQLAFLREAGFFSDVPFAAIGEIVYLSIVHNFGFAGLICFLVGMTAPLALFATRRTHFAQTPYKRSLAAGLAIYLVVSMSDGAILYIPVMAFFWFVATLLLSSNPWFPSAPAGVPARDGMAERGPAGAASPVPVRRASGGAGQADGGRPDDVRVRHRDVPAQPGAATGGGGGGAPVPAAGRHGAAPEGGLGRVRAGRAHAGRSAHLLHLGAGGALAAGPAGRRPVLVAPVQHPAAAPGTAGGDGARHDPSVAAGVHGGAASAGLLAHHVRGGAPSRRRGDLRVLVHRGRAGAAGGRGPA